MLSKIEITTDFNGPGGQTLSFKYSKTESWIFFKLHWVTLINIVNNLDIIYFIRSCVYSNLKENYKRGFLHNLIMFDMLLCI